MAEHSELIAEMAQIDKMTTQERLKLARRRRMQQLKKWSQREKEYNSNKKKKDNVNAKKPRKNDYKVHFVPSVMLLEAAARNDVEEGELIFLFIRKFFDCNNLTSFKAVGRYFSSDWLFLYLILPNVSK